MLRNALIQIHGYMIALFVALALLPITVIAASFDCTKVTSLVLKTICSTPVLSALDDDLGRAYTEASKKVQDPQALLNEQRLWLQKRNACNDNQQCIATTYQERIGQLKNAAPQADARQDQLPIAVINGEWYNLNEKYGYRLLNGIGIVTNSNNPLVKVGQRIIVLKMTTSNMFAGEQTDANGNIYKVKATLKNDGKIYFESDKKTQWVMERFTPSMLPKKITADEILNDAIAQIKSKDFIKAQQTLAPLLKVREPNAQYLMGYVYENASPPLQNYPLALEYYAAAGKQGIAAAIHAMAMAYDAGRGTEKDEAYAAGILWNSANKNYGISQYLLGLKYAKGNGVEVNFDTAINLLQKAAQQNVEGAQQSLEEVQKEKLRVEKEQIMAEKKRLAAIEKEKELEIERELEKIRKREAEADAAREQQRAEKQRKARAAEAERKALLSAAPNVIQLATVNPWDRDFVVSIPDLSLCDQRYPNVSCINFQEYKKSCGIAKNITPQAALNSSMDGLDTRLLESENVFSNIKISWEDNRCVFSYEVRAMFGGKIAGCRVFGIATAFAMSSGSGIVINRARGLTPMHRDATCKLN